MNTKRGWSILATTVAALLPLGAQEANTPLDFGGYAFGSWGQTRPQLAARGLFVHAHLTADYIRQSSSTRRPAGSAAVGLLALQAAVDTATAGWWRGGQFHAQVQVISGESLSGVVGDLQFADNIDAVPGVRLYDLWYQHEWQEGRTTLLVGMHDFNSEFYLLEPSGLFVHSSFALGPEFAQVGPSFFPQPTVGIRFFHGWENGGYLQLAAYDGVPGDPNVPDSTRVKLANGDGLLYVAEGGRSGERYKLGGGAWYHTHTFDDFRGETQDRNSGAYLIGERILIGGGNHQRTLRGFLRIGVADDQRNRFDRGIATGVTFERFSARRPGDTIGLGLAQARAGAPYRSVETAATAAETAYELTYRAELLPGFALQSDVQYIADPGLDDRRGDALVYGLRIQIAF